MNGIANSLIVSILLATGKKLYWKFRDPLKKAIENTIIYFSKVKGIEIDPKRFEKLLNGEIAEKELEAFKKGENFIDGKELALQFAVCCGFYHEDENKILDISLEIFDYFKTSFTDELLRNPSESINILNNIIQIHFNISHEEHEKILKDLANFKLILDSRISSIDQNAQWLVQKSEEDERRKELDETIRTKYADYKIVDLNFWEKTKAESDKEHLYLYYTNTDSSPVRLLDVIANDYYVVNDNIDEHISSVIKEGLFDQPALIKIISKGGEGKSTFLFHLAKKYFLDFNVIILENFNKEIFISIEKEFLNDIPKKPFLFLLDNPS